MVYTIKNSETGEFEYFYSDSARVKQPTYDEETGEPVNDQTKVRYRKHGHFHVPKQYLRGTFCDEMDNLFSNRYQRDLDIRVKHIDASLPEEKKPAQRTKPGYERDDYIKMDVVNDKIVLGYKRNHFLLFLLPTLCCCNFLLGAILAVLEIALHMWSHHKNKLTMHKDLYFRSPMHVISSQWCAICRTESDSKYNRIFDELNQQMRNAHRSETLKNITKAIG